MDPLQFNKTPIEIQAKYLNSFIVNKSLGITNCLLFEDRAIVFVISRNLRLLSAESFELPEDARNDAYKLLNGKYYLLLNCDNLSKVKDPLLKKILSANHQLN